MDIETICILIFIIGIAFLLIRLMKQTHEGFATTSTPLPAPSTPLPAPSTPLPAPSTPSSTKSAQLPTTNSAVPSDVPGVSTPDPTKSIPQMKDIQATLDALNNFESSYLLSDPSDIKRQTAQIQVKMKAISDNYPNATKVLQDALSNKSGSFPFTVSKLSEDRKTYLDLTHAFTSMPKDLSTKDTPITNQPKPTVKASTPGKITIQQLKSLNDRIKEEITRIVNLRSSASTMQAKQKHLEKLYADIKEMIQKIERKQMDINDVPIHPDDADNFLKHLKDDSVSSTLITPKGTSQTHPNVSFQDTFLQTISAQAPPNMNALLENAKFLKWNIQVNLEFQPELAQNERNLDRLEKVEKRITDILKGSKPANPEVFQMFAKELAAIRKQSTKGEVDIDLHKTTQTLNTTNNPASLEHKPYSKNTLPNLKATISSDTHRKTPDYTATTNNIQNRNTTASFDQTTVGGLDYKARVKELCKQIKASNIGNPVDLGCIENQDSVSKDYSWRGNYTMVCARLGNTWGAWYPEMFGCPKSA